MPDSETPPPPDQPRDRNSAWDLPPSLAEELQRARDRTNDRDPLSLVLSFFSSGFFFMIVGAIFLAIANHSMGETHSAMSFVFVVVGVAVLLYGTGTQGIGQFNSGPNADKVARYKIALAGGAGVIAFCVAGGIIAFAPEIKGAFQTELRYLRLHIKGTGGYESADIGKYLPDVRVNGNPVAAVRRGDYIEVFAPYLQTKEPAHFDVVVKLQLFEKVGSLKPDPSADFTILLDKNGNVVDGNAPSGKYTKASGYDFPYYVVQKRIDLAQTNTLDGVAPK